MLKKENYRIQEKFKNFLSASAATITREVQNFYLYLKKNYLPAIVWSVLFLLLYSSWITNRYPRLDTDAFINTPGSSFNWLDIGREGGVFTSIVFGLKWFNPEFAVICGFILMCISGNLFGYLFWRCIGKCGWGCALFGFAFFCSPIFAEQFYFELQIFQIGWAFLLCIIACGLSIYGAFKHSILSSVLASIALLWAICTYQSFAILFIAAIVFCFILLYRKWTIRQEKSVSLKEYGVAVLWTIGILVVSSAIYCIITFAFFFSDSYASGQIRWFADSFSACIGRIFQHIKQGFLGETRYYTIFYLITGILCIGLACAEVIAKKDKSGIIYIVAAIFLQFTPFLLTLVFANISPVRAQITYPFVLSANLMFLITGEWTFSRLRMPAATAVCVLFSFCVLFTLTGTTARVIYTENIRAQEDIRVATEIEQEVIRISDIEKPVAFIGEYPLKLNNACYHNQEPYGASVVCGYSIYNFFLNHPSHYLDNSNRICSLLQNFGYSFQNISAEAMLEARKVALSMPNWPKAGSIKDTENFVVVKFGMDIYTEDFLDPQIYEETTLPDDNEIKLDHYFDSASMTNELFQLSGWIKGENLSSLEFFPAIYLKDTKENINYRLSSSFNYRSDLEDVFGEQYKYSGFKAILDTKKLTKPLSDYEIITALENDKTNTVYWQNTGISLQEIL